MHPSAEVALDLATVPRNPSDLMAASRSGFNQHGYRLTYSAFAVMASLASRTGGDYDPGEVRMTLLPYPPDEVLALVGSASRGAQVAEAVSEFFLRFSAVTITNAETMAPGPSLEAISREFKGNAVFISSLWTGDLLMGLAADGHDSEALLDDVRKVLEGLSS